MIIKMKYKGNYVRASHILTWSSGSPGFTFNNNVKKYIKFNIKYCGHEMKCDG